MGELIFFISALNIVAFFICLFLFTIVENYIVNKKHKYKSIVNIHNQNQPSKMIAYELNENFMSEIQELFQNSTGMNPEDAAKLSMDIYKVLNLRKI